jgi:hypothetical protein
MKSGILASLLCLWTLRTHAQQFQNLGFEEVRTNNLTFREVVDGLSTGRTFLEGQGLTSDVIPSWSLSLNGTPLNQMFLDSPSRFVSQAYLVSTRRPLLPPGVIEGDYGLNFAPNLGDTYTISQRGTIPVGAQFLTFKGKGSWTAQFNSITLPWDPDLNDLENFLERWDVSRIAGQTGLLSISTGQFGQPGGGMMDSIRFIMVPEPRMFMLAAVALTAVFRLKAFGRKA